jgi:tetratricopeptide (TPR) repeat protein
MTSAFTRTLSVLALLGLAIVSPARAQDASNCTSTDASLQSLIDAVPLCQKNALFLATLGQRLNKLGRHLEAADHLERALMLEPGLKDAQLSYAIALTGSGDMLSATALLEQMLSDPSLPDGLRPFIEKQKATLLDFVGASRLSPLAIVNPTGWQSRFTLATRVGFDSNLLGSPNLDSLALTLAGQTLVLALDESYLARSGSYARADAQLDLQHSAADGSRWDAMASLRSRYSAAVAEAGSTQLDLLLERSHIVPNTVGSYVNVTASALDSKAGMHYTASGLAAGFTWRSSTVGGCQARAGVEWQGRDYLTNPVLSGRYSGVAGYLSCVQSSGLQWLLGLKLGRDLAQDGDRPGGDQQQASLRLSAFVPLKTLQRTGLMIDIEQSQQTDTTGYSPIIDSGSIRSVARRAARIEYQHPLWPATLWVVGAEWVAQSSTLTLFQQDSWGAYSGLRVSW